MYALFRSDMGWSAGEDLMRHLSAVLGFQGVRGTVWWKTLPRIWKSCWLEYLKLGKTLVKVLLAYAMRKREQMRPHKSSPSLVLMSPFSFLYCTMPACYICEGLSRRMTLPIFVKYHLRLHLVKEIMTPIIVIVWTGGLWGDPGSGPEEAGLGKPIVSKNLQPGLSFWKENDNKHRSLSFASGSGWFCIFVKKLVRVLPGLCTCSAILFLWQRAWG